MSLLLFNFAPSQTWIQVVLLVIGIVAVVKSAGWLTDGSVGIATRMGVPQIVIGLTVVAMGTSMPEFFVSLMSALGGKPGLAVGNVVGSNIFNALLIVGVAAMVAPISILHGTVKRDIPFALVASVVLLMLCLDGNISRVDSAILFVLFLVFMYLTLLEARKGMKAGEDSLEQPVNIGVGDQGAQQLLGSRRVKQNKLQPGAHSGKERHHAFAASVGEQSEAAPPLRTQFFGTAGDLPFKLPVRPNAVSPVFLKAQRRRIRRGFGPI